MGARAPMSVLTRLLTTSRPWWELGPVWFGELLQTGNGQGLVQPDHLETKWSQLWCQCTLFGATTVAKNTFVILDATNYALKGRQSPSVSSKTNHSTPTRIQWYFLNRQLRRLSKYRKAIPTETTVLTTNLGRKTVKTSQQKLTRHLLIPKLGVGGTHRPLIKEFKVDQSWATERADHGHNTSTHTP